MFWTGLFNCGKLLASGEGHYCKGLQCIGNA